MIKKYSSFINESIVHFSPELRKTLSLIDDDISKEILGIELKNVIPDMSFLDLAAEEGYLSFIRMVDAEKLLHKDPEHISRDDSDFMWKLDIVKKSGVFTNSRFKIKLGRFINTVFPGKWTNQEIEKFTHKFKAKLKDKWTFEIVSGEEIKKWYMMKNFVINNGTLGKSCMNGKGPYLEVYFNNPQVCRLLILKNEEGDKIHGRALIWRATNNRGFNYIMDRIYTTNEVNIEVFIDYAKKNGLAYKSYNDYNSSENVTYLNKDMITEMSVKLKDMEYSYFPYMDTFKRFDPDNNTLYNDDYEYTGCYILEEDDGGYLEINDD